MKIYKVTEAQLLTLKHYLVVCLLSGIAMLIVPAQFDERQAVSALNTIEILHADNTLSRPTQL